MISQLAAAQPIVDERGIMSQAMRIHTQQSVYDSLRIGTGSPEGNLKGGQGQRYMDDSGTAGAILYIKRDADIGGDTSQGWILV